MSDLPRSNLPQSIVIGREIEQYSRDITLDITTEKELWPGATPTLLYCRPGESTAYIGTSSVYQDENDHWILTWTPDAFVTQHRGTNGYVQVLFTEPGDVHTIIGASPVVRMTVLYSLQTQSDPPDPYDSWLISLLANAARSEVAREGAETAETGAVAAQGAAEAAQGAAEDARDVSVAAKDEAVESANKAEAEASVAEDAKLSAQNDALLAESWAVGGTGTRSGEDANNSKYYAERAGASAYAALTHEDAAAISAQEAAQSARTANARAYTASTKADDAQLYAAQSATSASNSAISANLAAQKADAAAGSAAAAESVLGRIPPDYSQLAADVADLKNQAGMYVLPQSYGAKGDGSTDDTAALSTAMNRSNAVIDGENHVYKLGELVLTECQNLVIQNFRFYHGISITLKHCENITFRNCVWDEFQDGGVADKNVQCVVLTTVHTGASEWVEANNWRMDEVCKGITFDNCQFLGTHFSESTPSLYENNKPHYNTGMCLRLEGVDGLRVIGCYFTQNRGNACIQQNCYAPLGDFEIINNFFYLNCWGGIELYRYTGMSSYPTRTIHGNRFIGHGLGYLPWSYLELFPENERGVGTAVLLGGNVSRIQNEPAYCSVCNNHFEDNNESSVEGWQWNPVKNNVILGNGVLQDATSVASMKAKYRIPYNLYVRKNPSQNPIYMGQYADAVRYPAGEIRSIENNTIGRTYGTKNPIMFRGYFYEQIVVRNNTMTDEALETDENAKYAHFLNVYFGNGLVWENNIGFKPYFNVCTFDAGEYQLDELQDVYNCTFTSQAFESLSKIDRFQQVRSARINPEYASLRDNDVSTVVDGKPTLGYEKKPVVIVIPTADWDIKNETGYTENGYVFGGETNPTILNTGKALGATDTSWTIFAEASTTGDNDAGNNTFLIKLLTFSDDSGNLSLEFGSRYTNEAWTWLFPNAVWNYDTAYQIDGNTARNFLRPERTSRFALRHKAGSGKIEVFAMRNGETIAAMSDIDCGDYAFTSGTAGTLRFGGVPNSDKPKSYYNGVITDARVFNTALSDAQISVLVTGTDLTPHTIPDPVYDIADESGYVSGTGLVMDGTFAIDTDIPLLENTDDFTIIAKFKFDNMAAAGAKPNFSFFPVFSAMSAEMADQAHTGYTDKGFDVGLSMQNGKDMSATARGGFINFRRDWRYEKSISIDEYNYSDYYNKTYTVVVQRKDNVITLYDNNLTALGQLTGAYATTTLSGNLTIGAKMGYGSGYTTFFKGVIKEFQIFDCAVDLDEIESRYPSIADNDVSKKGAVTYHLSNKNNKRKSARYALVEINYDLGEYNSAEYTQQYPQAFGIRMDQIYDDVYWVPCSSSKRLVLCKLCKWSAVYDPFESWDLEIINPGTVPNLIVKVDGVKVLLLSKQEAVPNTVDATDFHVTWDTDLTDLSAGDTVLGYVQYVPDDATTGLAVTVSSDDIAVATVSVSGQEITVTGVASGETLIRVSIPYGVEYVYDVSVT